MTDNEIIKAWEKILKIGHAPIGESWSVGGVVTTKLAKETLDMLNCQKAEIEKKDKLIEIADKMVESLKAENKKLKAEVERLKAEADMADGYADALEAKAKSEAIKEFAERLIDIAVGNWEHKVDVATLDNLVKEMVGDDNA